MKSYTLEAVPMAANDEGSVAVEKIRILYFTYPDSCLTLYFLKKGLTCNFLQIQLHYKKLKLINKLR